ncbi:NUDIX hydrolase [Haematobacter missouriensis]|uniref:NAD(+) diphosphatase n=1 Tax=Haematobacter missouriensis TaxID=366616 RepID=A0A212ART0_9RHOB|nr:NAD(+) diphosphatase [Haematobacter missouriensis]KFI33801.1 NUDIX hydrolase [Haematobacter missouriensis]OWJ72276.1 NADH pyrophosphatase [Haematobacter missouriensis]OWJ84183.1 NADH pyrophosphatase [Haematobacter missouriensis]
MRDAEDVTFGSAGLDRASGLRAKPDALAALLKRPDARVLPLWQGLVPVVEAGPAGEMGLVTVSPGHPALAEAGGAPTLLGLDDGVPWFGADISAWSPDIADAAANAAFLDPREQRHPALPADSRFVELRAVMTRLTRREAEIAATARALFGWHATHGFCPRCGHASEPAMGGWIRRCPNCRAEQYPRTDPVVIMLITRGDRVLLGRSAAWPQGMYSLLAGFIEPGETVEAAVRREVLEEAGVRVGAVQYLASQPWPFPASLMIGCRGEALSDAIEIDPAEIEDARWVSRQEMVDVLSGANPAIRPAREGAIAHFLIHRWMEDRLD